MRTLLLGLLAATALSTAAHAQYDPNSGTYHAPAVGSLQSGASPFGAPSAPLTAEEKDAIHAEKLAKQRAAKRAAKRAAEASTTTLSTEPVVEPSVEPALDTSSTTPSDVLTQPTPSEPAAAMGTPAAAPISAPAIDGVQETVPANTAPAIDPAASPMPPAVETIPGSVPPAAATSPVPPMPAGDVPPTPQPAADGMPPLPPAN